MSSVLTLQDRIRNKVAIQRQDVPKTYLSFIPPFKVITLTDEQIEAYKVL